MDFAVTRRWDGLVNPALPLLMLGAALAWLTIALVLEARLQARLRRLTPLEADVGPGVTFVFDEYVAGRLNPALLEALRACAVNGIGTRTALMAVSVEVAAGRYQEALLWRALCSEPGDGHESELILRINEAEAMANLGRVEEALHWVSAEASLPFTIAGTAAHRAWCLALLNRPDDAALALQEGSANNLNYQFRSEWHLAEVAVALSARRWDEAEHALLKAEHNAHRASTGRNVHYSRGLLLAAQGRHQDALPHFEKGAACIYVGQGGEALLTWGDSLKTLGRDEEARSAWRLCSSRDPQAPAAARALARLGEVNPTRVA